MEEERKWGGREAGHLVQLAENYWESVTMGHCGGAGGPSEMHVCVGQSDLLIMYVLQ